MITQVTWFRTFLQITADAGEVITLTNGQRTFPLEYANGIWTFSLINTDGTGFLPEGSWRLDVQPTTGISQDVLLHLDGLSRIFRYDKGYAYIVTFTYTDTGLVLATEFVRHNSAPQKRSFKQRLMRLGVNTYYRFCRLFARHTDRRILFLSETRDDTSDNMRAVLSRLCERGLDQQYRIECSFRNEFSAKENAESAARQVRRIASADILIVDDYMPVFSYLQLAKGVKLVQLWHAGFGYKLVGYARFGIEGSPHPYQSCHRQYTHAVIGNEALKNVYAEVFGVNKDVLLPTGMPRLDHFLDAEVIQDAKERMAAAHPEIKGRRVILFAPTYRGYNQKDAYYDYSRIDQQALYDMCVQTNSVLIFKWHHFVREVIVIPEEFRDRLLDATEENIADLMYVSDVLVTDYSSCFYDYLLLQRPIVFYIYDEAEYAATRGVHYPVRDTAPGILCTTSEELVSTLAQPDIPRREPPDYMVDLCLKNHAEGVLASDRIIDAMLAE